MPISRNRKRKSNKNNNHKAKTASPIKFKELFNLHFNDCRKCDGLRDVFNFSELPEGEKRHWERSGLLDQINIFVYCPECDEYSAIIDIE